MRDLPELLHEAAEDGALEIISESYNHYGRATVTYEILAERASKRVFDRLLAYINKRAIVIQVNPGYIQFRYLIQRQQIKPYRKDPYVHEDFFKREYLAEWIGNNGNSLRSQQAKSRLNRSPVKRKVQFI